MKEVPVRFMDLTDKQATRLALADNKLSSLGEDDDAVIRELLSEMDTMPAGFDEPLSDLDLELPELDETFDAPISAEFYVMVRGPIARQLAVVEAVEAAAKGCKVLYGSVGGDE